MLVSVERMTGKIELKLTQMRSCGVTAPCVVILSRYALEGGGLVDGNAAGPVLVFEVWILHRRAEGRELVRLPGPHR